MGQIRFSKKKKLISEANKEESHNNKKSGGQIYFWRELKMRLTLENLRARRESQRRRKKNSPSSRSRNIRRGKKTARDSQKDFL